MSGVQGQTVGDGAQACCTVPLLLQLLASSKLCLERDGVLGGLHGFGEEVTEKWGI